MNLKQTKEQLKNAMTAYFTKDEDGNYIIPLEKQRPVFIMGPPGIGKTAIVEQVAAEMGVGLISYSLTHHTRQSALGLPFITKKNYGGTEYDVSNYTMSEIIASVYDLIEETGVKEGILFLDEVNCVSETLQPIMLQFLQYKVFGKHRVPEGWIVVTAGNPPEYNNSVHEFDIVTWDRLKRIDTEPDFEVWKEYAYSAGVHPAVMTYLEIKKANFYKIETSVDGKKFATARGWEDLSQMIKLYEMNNLHVDIDLISQYLQFTEISKDFASYYNLFIKYKSDYQINEILEGNASQDIKNRAKNAKFDERLSLSGLVIEACTGYVQSVMNLENNIANLMPLLKKFRDTVLKNSDSPEKLMNDIIESQRKELDNGKKAGKLSAEDQKRKSGLIKKLENMKNEITGQSNEDASETVKNEFTKLTATLKKNVTEAESKLSNAFIFYEECFGEGQEILILGTELTLNKYTALFISKFGCKEYFKHNKELLFHDRQADILKQIEKLGL